MTRMMGKYQICLYDGTTSGITAVLPVHCTCSVERASPSRVAVARTSLLPLELLCPTGSRRVFSSAFRE